MSNSDSEEENNYEEQEEVEEEVEEEEQEEVEEGVEEEVEEEVEEVEEEIVEVEEELWSYSTCQGNKKALFIGINYAGSAAPLNGCHNDVTNLHTFVTEQWGYEGAEIKILIDDDEDPDTQPTRANIIEAMHWLVEGASQNDALFLHYSGHGGTEVDTSGDEADGTDETICPVDYEEAGQIIDDELHDILVKPLPRGCRLTVVFDACHSGTALDLPYTYGTDGEVKVISTKENSAAALRDAAAANESGDMNVLELAARQMSLAASGGADAATELTKKTRSSPADVIYLSGCRDIQYSADVQEDGEATGALSHALVKTLTENRDQSYQELLVNILTILAEGGREQVPQLSSSHPMDTSLGFVI